jgi:hypothetical protein
MDSASSRRRCAGNSLAIENSFEKARYIGGIPREGKELNYIGELLDLYIKHYMLSLAMTVRPFRVDSKRPADHR